MNTQKSTGQGNLRSYLHLRPAGSSLIQRLATRSITGPGLEINIHQHCGWRLHLEWLNGKTRSCFERFFETFEDVDRFCREMLDGGLEGLCDCVGTRITTILEDKITICRLEPTPQSQLDYYRYRDVDKSWKKQLHELDRQKYRCHCPISSTEWVISEKGWTVQSSSSVSSSE